MDISVRRDIDLKKQELLELEVSISGKNIDISKQTSGKTDEMLSLESELKIAQSELKKTLTKKEQYEIRAPIDGIIRNVKMFPGDTINTTSNS
jgi:multidrug resistance efflux pump